MESRNGDPKVASGASVLVIGLKAFHPSLPMIFFHLPATITEEMAILEDLYDPDRADQVRLKAWSPELRDWFQVSAPPGCLLPTMHLVADPSLNLAMTDSGVESADDWVEMALLVATMNGIKGPDGAAVLPPWYVAPEILFIRTKERKSDDNRG